VPPRSNGFGTTRSAASHSDMTAVVNLLREAERPVFFIGHGATLSEAGPEMTMLSNAWASR
jgi:acetolactate synthase-1/2/3 large subunit